MDQQPIRPYEKDYDVQMDITYERNKDLINVSRDGYTILDWISDIGGIQGILISAIAIILGYWNYNYFDNYMVQKLYMIAKSDAEGKVYSSDEDRLQGLNISMFSGLFDAICDTLPSCLQCCRSSRNDLGLAMGRDKLYKETNIVNIIQSRRYFNAALKTLLSKSQREHLKEQTRFWVFKPDKLRSSDKNEATANSSSNESSISMHTSMLNLQPCNALAFDDSR